MTNRPRRSTRASPHGWMPHANNQPLNPPNSSTVHRLQSTLHRLPSTVYRLPSTVYRLPPTAYRLPPTAYRLPPTAYMEILASSNCHGIGRFSPPETLRLETTATNPG